MLEYSVKDVGSGLNETFANAVAMKPRVFGNG
jgi:hypothetical protein